MAQANALPTAQEAAVLDSSTRRIRIKIIAHNETEQNAKNIAEKLKGHYDVSVLDVENIGSEDANDADYWLILTTDETAWTKTAETNFAKLGIPRNARGLAIYQSSACKVARKHVAFPMIKVENNDEKMAREVMIFIEAQKLAESNTTKMEDNHFYATLLISSLSYPQDKTMDWKSYTTLSSLFNDVYGGFKNLNIGPMIKFLEKKSIFLSKPREEKCKINATVTKEICQLIDRVNLTFTAYNKVSFVQGNTLEQQMHKSISPTVMQQNTYQTEISKKVHDILGEIHSGHAMFLVTNVPHTYGDLQGITNIPWVRVFDFDTESRSSGLLSNLEKTIKRKSNFTISTPFDSIKKLSQLATDWMFINGFDDKPDTILDGTVTGWYRKHHVFIKQLHSTQTEFCQGKRMPVFLVLWYKSTKFNDKLLERFLADASAEFSTKTDNLPLEIIVCMPSDLTSNESINDHITELDLAENTFQLSFLEVVSWLSHIKVSSSVYHQVMLPRRSDLDGDKERVAIIPEDLAWVGSQIELVSTNSEKYKREVKNPGLEFVKGGEITWEEIKMKKIAIHRTPEKEMCKRLTEDYIKQFRSVIISVNHSPGGGGTTFAKQILWYLQSEVPCGILIPKVAFEYEEITERLDFLFEKTLLPFVLLVDGGSRSEIENLFAEKSYPLMIIHVQRTYSQLLKSKYEPRNCHLSGDVTLEEASQLQKLFSRFAPKSNKGLLKLCDDVALQKHTRQIYEFGLAAFDHEYKGVNRFVRGNLDCIEKGKQSHEVKNILTYLSLLTYFGQTGIPPQTFHSLLPGTKRFVTVGAIPQAECFIVEAKSTWKINYNVVAKQILVYTLGDSFSTDSSSGLPIYVKQRMHEPIINLIRLIGSVCSKNNNEEFVRPLVNAILKRDYEDVSITDSVKDFKKSKMSRLLEHVSEEHRLPILQELTNAFPNHAEFHAHLGRYLGMMDKYDEAGKQLKTAVDIRTAETAGANSSRKDNVLGRIYHMFGCIRTREIKHIIKHIRSNREISMNDLTHQVLPVTQHALKCFNQARKFVSHNRNYSYMGEIGVRLAVMDFLYVHLKKTVDEQPRLSQFITESRGECERLLLECEYELPATELKRVKSEYDGHLSLFYRIFTKLSQGSNAAVDVPAVARNRYKISQIKTNYKQLSVNKIKNVVDVKKIIKLNDEILLEVFRTNDTYVSISSSILEWLDAIRHPLIKDEYPITNVLFRMENWNRIQGSANFSYSVFYVFILYFLRVVTFPAGKLLTKFLYELQETKSKVIKQYKRSGFKRDLIELYANHDDTTIRKLVSRKEVEPWDDKSNLFQKSEKLKVCTGTVFQSNNARQGLISFKVQQHTIKLYFTPERCGVNWRQYAQQSMPVEFFIGFGVAHGAEALSVQPLQKWLCNECKTEQLMITLNEAPNNGRCCRCNFTAELNPA